MLTGVRPESETIILETPVKAAGGQPRHPVFPPLIHRNQAGNLFCGNYGGTCYDRRLEGAEMTNLKPIRTEADYEAALARIDEIFEAELDSPEARELDALVDLVESYESKHFPLEESDTAKERG